MQQMIPVFLTVFLAELGDKTQLATLLFASDKDRDPWMVFFASAGALVVAAAIGVLCGAAAAKYIDGLPMKLIAGVGFIAVGLWTVWSHFTQA
jgi:putative Ca2+/H+ antiporter (TMEM165/GDT1 family)